MSDLQNAIQLISSRLNDFHEGYLSGQDSRRILHGRGKTFPDLDWCSIDSYEQFMFVTFFKDPKEEFPINFTESMGFEYELKNLLMSSVTTLKIDSLMVQRRYVPMAPIELWYGDYPQSAYALRAGLRYSLSFRQQNLGFFLDIEPARKWLESCCKGKRILNLFSYTCTFSVVANTAGADSVVNIDLSRRSLSVGRENHTVNGLDAKENTFLGHDILKSWGKLKKLGPYDIVIIDPPSFQKGSFIATKDYCKVLKKMKDLVTEQGCFLACLNAPEITLEEFKSEVESCCPEFMLEEILEPSEDFPDVDRNHSLKMLVYKRAELSG